MSHEKNCSQFRDYLILYQMVKNIYVTLHGKNASYFLTRN